MLDQKEINPFSVALVMWGPEYQILRRRGLQRRRNKTWPCLDSIPGRRRWFYRKTVATIRSTMCPHLTHNAFTFSPLRTTEAFPCSEFQAEHFQALKNISQVVCFVRHSYQGSLRAWFEWSKTEDASSIGKPDCVTHILYNTCEQIETWKLYLRQAWSNEEWVGGCETSHLGKRPMGRLGGVAADTSPPIAAHPPSIQPSPTALLRGCSLSFLHGNNSRVKNSGTAKIAKSFSQASFSYSHEKRDKQAFSKALFRTRTEVLSRFALLSSFPSWTLWKINSSLFNVSKISFWSVTPNRKSNSYIVGHN